MNGSVPGEKLTLWRRVAGVVWGSPAGTMGDIARNPDFLPAAALILGADLALAAAQLPKIREFTVWTLQNLPSGVTFSGPQMEVAVNAATVSSLAGSVAIPPLVWLITAALLKFFNLFNGEKAGFRTLFAVAVFANLPVVLGGVLKTALVLAVPAQKLARLTVSPAFLLPPPGPVPDRIYILLSQFDPFTVWSMVLAALGGSLAMKVPLWRALVYVIGVWVLYVIWVTFISGLGMSVL